MAFQIPLFRNYKNIPQEVPPPWKTCQPVSLARITSHGTDSPEATEGGHHAVPLESARGEAEKWGQWLERQQDVPYLSMHGTHGGMNRTQNWSSEWTVLTCYEGSL